MRVGKCSKCGRDAAYNAPHINPNGALFCNECAYESPLMLKGVGQHLNEDGSYKEDSMGHYTKNHCTLALNHGMAAWTEDGRHSYKLSEIDKAIAAENPEQILDAMISMRSSGRFRCSDCGIEMSEDEVGAFPLFAGVICKQCLMAYNEKIAEERREGKICGMCKQPLSLCCC